MSEKHPITLGNGCAVSDRLLIVAGFPDSLGVDQKHTRLYYLNLDLEDPWQHTDWPGHTVTGLCLRKPREGVLRAGCALSDEGYVQIANSSEETVERIPGSGIRDVEEGRSVLGHVRGIKDIDSSLFVCGYYGQIYKRTSTGWESMSDDLRRRGDDVLGRAVDRSDGEAPQIDLLRRTANLNAIDGNDEIDVYTCGLAGYLYHLSENSLTKIESGTDAHLLDLHCVSEKETLVCGYDQTLISGNHDEGFRILHEIPSDIQFWSVRKFQGDIYVGTTRGLWRLRGSRFDAVRQKEIDFGDTTVIQQIDSVADDYLWIVGDRHVFRYDGRDRRKVRSSGQLMEFDRTGRVGDQARRRIRNSM